MAATVVQRLEVVEVDPVADDARARRATLERPFGRTSIGALVERARQRIFLGLAPELGADRSGQTAPSASQRAFSLHRLFLRSAGRNRHGPCRLCLRSRLGRGGLRCRLRHPLPFRLQPVRLFAQLPPLLGRQVRHRFGGLA